MWLDWSQPISEAALASVLAGCLLGPPKRGPLEGGRQAGWNLLRDYDPSQYGRLRNFLDAPVSRLSPYLRHGMLAISEVRQELKSRFPNDPAMLEEFLRQLAWRDFFEKVLAWHGAALQDDLEEAKHQVERQKRLPLDVIQSQTGLPCIDGMLQELFETGYLHNHERLWFAAYLCHYRGVDWKYGAKLFRQYLYDGDLASNSSSWQWVESTFAAKPYYMNKDNISRYSGAGWCRDCAVQCPFDAGYDVLERRLFGGRRAPLAYPERQIDVPDTQVPWSASASRPQPASRSEVLVWVHDAAISPEDPAVKANPSAPLAFVWDTDSLQPEPWAFHRLAFVTEGVQELFQTHQHQDSALLIGSLVDELSGYAQSIGAKSIHLSEHPNPWVQSTANILKESFDVVVHPRPTLTNYAEEPRRFSRYWNQVAPQVLGYKPKSGSKRMHQ